MRPPIRSRASSTMPLRPARLRSSAAARPAAPAPIIRTSEGFVFSIGNQLAAYFLETLSVFISRCPFLPKRKQDQGFAQKVDPIWNEPVSTGNAGALARYEREARKQLQRQEG